jgi:phospholipase/carboxylesterase
MSIMEKPTVAWSGAEDSTAPLVVLLHGRGSNEVEISSLAAHLPGDFAYAAVRAPLSEGGGFAWFANRGIGRPVTESLSLTTSWLRSWLDSVAPSTRRVILVGFSGGAAFAGALLLQDPTRFAGAAILYGTLPFDAGVPTTPDRLDGVPVLVIQGNEDSVIPRELLDRTWDYVSGESKADATAIRHAGGHAISRGALNDLVVWLEGLR